MSDPVTHHDIEDVLSSIRRLVAQGDPRRDQAAPSEQPFARANGDVTNGKDKVSDDTPAAERLVLTPAFRITPQTTDVEQATEAAKGAASASFDAAMRGPESDVIPTKDSRPMPAPGKSPAERASLEATIAELEAAVNSHPDEWEPDGSEETEKAGFPGVFASKLEAIRPSRLFRRADTNAEDDSAAVEKETADDTPQSTEAVLNDIVVDHIAEAVQEEIAESFPHLTAADEGPEPVVALHQAAMDDVAEQLVSEQVQSGTDDAKPVAEDAPVVEDAPVADAAPAEEDTVVRLTPERPTAANASFAPPPFGAPPESEDAVEPVVVEVAEQPESEDVAEVEPEAIEADAPEVAEVIAPEVAEPATDFAETPTFRHAASFQEVYDPVAEATADAAEAAPDAGDIYGDELQPDPNATGTAVATPAPAGQLMDPDMMRDMVSQMIREELQGEMGERITRNVRKLVRREINRVLSAQEFD